MEQNLVLVILEICCMGKKKIKSVEILNKYDCYTIKWYLTDWCNYRCSYCFQKHNNNKPTIEKLKYNAYRIASFIRANRDKFDKRNIRLSITGGEISVFPLVEILKPIFNEGIDILSCITNGSGDLYSLVKECEKRKIKFYCDVSFHEEHVDLLPFIKKVSKLMSLNLNFHWKVLSVVTNKNIKIQKELYNKCKGENIELVLNYERANEDGGESIKLTDKNGIDLIKNFEKEKSIYNCLIEYNNGVIKKYISRRDMESEIKIDPFGWSCDINRNMISIYPDLSAKLGFCDNKKYININEIEIAKFNEICKNHFCLWCFPCKAINEDLK